MFEAALEKANSPVPLFAGPSGRCARGGGGEAGRGTLPAGLVAGAMASLASISLRRRGGGRREEVVVVGGCCCA